jgi:hypothetical protein
LITGTYDITVKPKPYTTTIPITLTKAFTVRGPEIVSLSSSNGRPKDKITITGKYFSTLQGKVYLEYQKNGKPKRKYCTITSWTMDRATGVSEIRLTVPQGLLPAPYPLRVSNKIGVAATTFTINQ